MYGLIIIILIALLLNLTVYTLEYISWIKDCERFGRENLAVSLGESMRATFFCITLPCIVGMLLGLKDDLPFM